MPPAVPRATYRLQLSSQFGFDAAAAIVPYLHDLGISHLYASPFMKARAGSTHGYDITDHNRLNPEFGGEAAFDRLSETLARHDMGLILDFVPNHMGIGHADNAWWLDVLEWGPRSPYARMFDIDWETLPYRRHGGLLLPILGKPYGEALEQGEIVLRFDAQEGSLSFWYFDHRLPLRPERYSETIKTAVAFAGAENAAAGRELLAQAERYGDLRSPSRAAAPELKAALAAIDGAAEVLERGLAAFRADAADPARLAVLHRLLERQHYRLAHWRVAISEINYRRFFDINDLAGIRVEDPKTFRLIHRKVLELVQAGKLQGIRLDHIDGLYDPAQYCLRLRKAVTDAGGKSFYTVVEKILAPEEPMPQFAGVAGTTGYAVLNLVSRVLVDGEGLPALERIWQTQAAPSRNFGQMVEDAKTRIIETSLASEFTVLARLLSRIAAGHWPSRDFTADRLRAALQLFVLHFPVYRTYITHRCSDADRATIAKAIDAARERWYGSDTAVLDFLQDALTLDLVAPDRQGYSRARVRRFAAKVQQFTGPVTAKAVEDTAFYRYHRLLALNEVGNDPSLPALAVEEFHAAMIARAQNYPHAMTATATHDTKRGEDARARLLALSEVAEEWGEAVRYWTELNAPLVVSGRQRVPSRAHEYMLYQAMLGAWEGTPTEDFVARIKAYALKAAREGKLETSWANPNESYERGLDEFVARVLEPGNAAFVEAFDAFARRLALLGALNGLSQLVLKLTMPGMPDIYQGTESWDLSLVDPDNRRLVDFEARREALAAISREPLALPADWRDGTVKLALTRRLLQLRAAAATLFSDGGYEPLGLSGRHAGHAVAFARHLGGEAIIVVAGRHFAALTDHGRRWPQPSAFDASLDLGRYRAVEDALAGSRLDLSAAVPLSAVFTALPLAVLRAETR